jgi:hypothetical protein
VRHAVAVGVAQQRRQAEPKRLREQRAAQR